MQHTQSKLVVATPPRHTRCMAATMAMAVVAMSTVRGVRMAAMVAMVMNDNDEEDDDDDAVIVIKAMVMMKIMGWAVGW